MVYPTQDFVCTPPHSDMIALQDWTCDLDPDHCSFLFLGISPTPDGARFRALPLCTPPFLPPLPLSLPQPPPPPPGPHGAPFRPRHPSVTCDPSLNPSSASLSQP